MKRAVLLSLLVLSTIGYSQNESVLEIDNIKEIPMQYVNLREADAMYLKRYWRVIPLKEKMNHFMYYPLQPTARRSNLTYILRDNIKSGQIMAYDPIEGGFSMPLTAEEAFGVGESIDTIAVQQPDGTIKQQTIYNELPYGGVTTVRIWEEWYVNKQTSKMEVQIIGMTPVREVYDENGEFKGTQPLFTVYFPSIRPLLINEKTFNPFNDAQRLSFDERLTMRMFSSIITKDSNVYGRRIEDYKAGIDAMLEAQRLQEELRDYEQDLWEY